MGVNSKKGAGEVKCVIVGDGAVGKTSMMLSYTTGGIMLDYIPTCFDCYTADMRVLDKNYTLSLIDTAGQETYDRLRTLSYYDTDVFVVCFSVADTDSFENIRSKWIPELRQYRPHTPFILVGTQSDLRNPDNNISSVNEMSSATNTGNRLSSASQTTVASSNKSYRDAPIDCVDRKQAKTLARKCGARAYMECSALEGTGIEEVFQCALITAVTPKKKRTPHFIKSIKSAFKFKKHRNSKSPVPET